MVQKIFGMGIIQKKNLFFQKHIFLKLMKMNVLFYHNNILALFFLFKYISNGCSGVLKIHCLL